MKFLKSLISQKSILWISFNITGILSTLWFLVRVIPKPSRAAYPCMRAAFPVMSGFVMYLLAMATTMVAIRRVKISITKGKYAMAGLFAIVGMLAGWWMMSGHAEKSWALATNQTILGPNEVVGNGRGIFPGRVAWVHNPGVASWNGTDGHWYDDKNIAQEAVSRMVHEALLSVTGTASEKEAWKKLFVSFNLKKRSRADGYSKDQKVAIKINENNTYSHANSDELNASPQMVLALVQSLVKEGGVPENKITVFDASRFVTDNVYSKLHAAFPDVLVVDNEGGEGRIKATYVDNAIPYSVNNGKLARGLARCAVEADYLINMALLKGHVGQGVTLCAKNYYGVTSINKDWRLNAHDNFNQDPAGKPKYMTFVDFLGHKDLGEKTMLFLIDGLYGSKWVNGPPTPKWQMAPFNNDWACSLFASQDGVAIDAVGLDLLRNEFPDAPDMNYSDQYLVEAATANNPPSKTNYDPEGDHTGLPGLGVMEHWNNAKDKQYSRNLGKKEGIELVYIPLK